MTPKRIPSSIKTTKLNSSLLLKLFLYLAQLVALISATCYSPAKKGYTRIGDHRVFSNSSFATVDFFGMYRVFNLDNPEPIFYRDLTSILSFEKIRIINDPIFISDTELMFIVEKKAWMYNIETQDFFKVTNGQYSVTFEKSHSLKAPGLPILIQKKYSRDVIFFFYDESPRVFSKFRHGDDGIGDANNNTFKDVVFKTADFSAINKARAYMVLANEHTNQKKLFYNQIDATTKAHSTKAWGNITAIEIVSEVILHPSEDLLVVSGIKDADFLGITFFMDKEFMNLFSIDSDSYFDFGMFVEGSSQMVVNFQGGKMCILDYDLASKTGVFSGCKPCLGVFLEPKNVIGNKLLAIHESKLVVFDFPSLEN